MLQLLYFLALIPYQTTHLLLIACESITDNIFDYITRIIYWDHALLCWGLVWFGNGGNLSVFIGRCHFFCHWSSVSEKTMGNMRNYSGTSMWYETIEGWYYRLSKYRDHIQHDNTHSPTVTRAKLLSTFAVTNDTPYLALLPPLHSGCDFSASIVRPQNWPGRRLRQKGGRAVALVAQWWYTGRSDIAMDAMVAVMFWACSKQSHKGRRGGRSLTGRSKEAGGRHTHRHGGRMDAQWSAIGRPVKNTHCCEHCVSIWATLLPSLYHHCASFGTAITRLYIHIDGNGISISQR